MQVTVGLVLTFVLVVKAKNVVHREPRFIRKPYTTTVFTESVVTSWVPSSCVYLDATLLPCRNVRNMRFPSFLPNNWQEQDDQQQVKSESESEIHQTPWTWGEYFGFYAPTVTTTQTKLQTSLAVDSRIIVTFAVKGCRPLTIPSGLDRCPEETLSTVSIQEILPTSTVGAMAQVSTTINPHSLTPPNNTRLIDLAAAKAYDEMRRINNDVNQNLQQSSDLIESSDNQDDLQPVQPTEALPF